MNQCPKCQIDPILEGQGFVQKLTDDEKPVVLSTHYQGRLRIRCEGCNSTVESNPKYHSMQQHLRLVRDWNETTRMKQWEVKHENGIHIVMATNRIGAREAYFDGVKSIIGHHMRICHCYGDKALDRSKVSKIISVKEIS